MKIGSNVLIIYCSHVATYIGRHLSKTKVPVRKLSVKPKHGVVLKTYFLENSTDFVQIFVKLLRLIIQTRMENFKQQKITVKEYFSRNEYDSGPSSFKLDFIL